MNRESGIVGGESAGALDSLLTSDSPFTLHEQRTIIGQTYGPSCIERVRLFAPVIRTLTYATTYELSNP